MNLNKFSTKLLFATISGLLLTLSFPQNPMPFFAFIGLVPLLFLFYKYDIPEAHKYILVYVTFFIYHTGSLWWISSWTRDTDIFLLISGLGLDILHPLFFFVPFVIYFWLEKRMGKRKSLILFPLIFLFFEWSHSLGDVGFPWLTLGNTQILNLYWIQFIDIAGIWGASLIILYINVLVLLLLVDYIDSGVKQIHLFIVQSRKASLYITVISLLFFLPYFYGFFAMQKYDYKANLLKNDNVEVAVIQPNINPWKKWETSAVDQLETLLKTSDSILATNPNIKLLVFPETAIPMLYTDFNSLQDISILQNWCNLRNVTILTGIAEFYFIPKNEESPSTSKQLAADPKQYYQTFNSSILVSPNPQYRPGDKIDSYRKSKLTPFGEQIPFQETFPGLSKFALWSVGISSWNIGSGADILQTNIDGKDVRIGNIICIESIYPDFVKDFVKAKANMFTVITNDGWYDYTVGPRQHYLLACLRAIENRRYVARSANTGISGFISPLGVSLKEVPQNTRIATNLIIPLVDEVTIYSKYGDWLPNIVSTIVLILLFVEFIKVLRNFLRNPDKS